METENVKLDYELSNIICLKCGSTIGPHSMNGYRYYRCRGFNRKKCGSKTIRAEMLEEAVQMSLIYYAESLKNMGVEGFITEYKRCFESITESEEKLKKLRNNKINLLKDFFKSLQEKNNLDYEDKYIIPRYKDVLKEENITLFNLEQLEFKMLNILEYLQKKSFQINENEFVDFLNLTAFREASKKRGLCSDEDMRLYRVYLNISTGTGKIVTINPIFSSYDDIPFRIDNMKRVEKAIEEVSSNQLKKATKKEMEKGVWKDISDLVPATIFLDGAKKMIEKAKVKKSKKDK